MKKIALIPSNKPNYELLGILEELKSKRFDIVVVDDGSKDSYKNIYEACENYASVLTLDENKGKGYAIKQGLRYIKNRYKEYIVVIINQDGEHDIDDALKLVDYAEDHLNTLVIGKRKLTKDMSLRSKLGNIITRLIFNIITSSNIYDTQNGLRAFSYKLTDFMIDIPGDKYNYEMNVLFECVSYKIKIKELYVKTIYKNKHSHFRIIKDSLLIYKSVLRYLLIPLICLIIDYLIFYLIFKYTNIVFFNNIFSKLVSFIINYSLINRFIIKRYEFNNRRKVSIILENIILILINSLSLFICFRFINLNILLLKLIIDIIINTINIIIKKYIFKS